MSAFVVKDDNRRLRIENESLRSHNAELRAALAKYGDHDGDCPARLRMAATCTCGYRAALAEGEGGK